MNKLIVFSTLLVFAGIASASAVFYHDVITFENCAQNHTPKAVITNGYFIYYKAKADTGDSYIYFPIHVGYAFDERWSASFIMPLEYYMSGTAGIDNEFYLNNLWIKGKFIPMLKPNISVGPRIAFRLPIGTDRGTDYGPEDCMAIDFAGLFHMGYTTAFKLDAQIGMTLEMAKNNVKDPSPFYFVAEYGYEFNPKMSFSGVFGVAIPVIKGETAGVQNPNDPKEYWVGEKFNWKLSPNVTINEVFSYRLGDSNTTKDIYFGAGVTANIPM